MSDLPPVATAPIPPVAGDISQLSDDQLQALHQQHQALSGMSDADLQQLHAKQQPWSGTILPISGPAEGVTNLDMNAGIPGMVKKLGQSVWGGVTAPGDVYTGTTPILGDNGQPNPDLIDRAANLAAVATPLSAASRAGELMPGAMWNRNVPSAQTLKVAGGAGYDAARNAGLDISGDAVGNMASGLQQKLQSDHGVIEKTAPKTFAILNELANPPAGGIATVAGLDAARRGLSATTLEGGTEGFAAGHAVRGIDDFMASLNDSSIAPSSSAASRAEIRPNPGGGFDIDSNGPEGILYASTQDEANRTAWRINNAWKPYPDPAAVAQTLSDARGNYAAAQRSNKITGGLDKANTGILEQAEARAEASHSGRNLDNSIRQRVASLLQSPQNLAGFSQPEIDALKGVVSGGPVQNTARVVGNMLGGGGGMHAGLMGAVGAGAGAALEHGAIPAAIGAAIPPTVGYGAKMLENALAKRSLGSADQTVRMNSPLYQAMQAQGRGLAPAMTRNSAVLREGLPGLLSAPQQSKLTPSDLAKLLAGWT